MDTRMMWIVGILVVINIGILLAYARSLTKTDRGR